MAKKKPAARSTTAKKASAKKVKKYKIGPLASAVHVLHRVHTAAPYHGKACTLIVTRPGTSAEASAFNLAPGFKYTIRHKKRPHKPCEFEIEQGPFEGIPTSSSKSSKSLVVLDDPPTESRCIGIQGCDLACPDPDNFPFPNCTTDMCDPATVIAPAVEKKGTRKV